VKRYRSWPILVLIGVQLALLAAIVALVLRLFGII
jgi:hypothetical protein